MTCIHCGTPIRWRDHYGLRVWESHTEYWHTHCPAPVIEEQIGSIYQRLGRLVVRIFKP